LFPIKKERLTNGKALDIDAECSVFEAASLLKEYIRQLPESLMPGAEAIKLLVLRHYAREK
jgi:hypothetical protein